MIVTIETERLLIRPVVPADAEAIYRWTSDPEVTRYMIYTTHPNVESTRAWLAGRDLSDENSYDLGIALKDTGELVGMGGLVYEPAEDIWLIGYNLRRDMWGQGIVVKAMEGIIAEIQKRRTIRAIRGEFAVENAKSGRVMEKLGMQYLRDSAYSKFDGSITFPSKIYIRYFS